MFNNVQLSSINDGFSFQGYHEFKEVLTMAYTSNVIYKELRLPICLLYVMGAHAQIKKIPLVEGRSVARGFIMVKPT